MESGKQSALVFRVAYSFLLGATLLCILLVVINPEKILQLYPRSGAVVHLYADSIESKGTSAAVWVDRDNSVYECNIGYGVSYPYCGMVIKFKRADSKNYHLLDYFEFGDAEMVEEGRRSAVGDGTARRTPARAPVPSSRRRGFSSLVLGVYERGELRYAGRAGSG